MDIRELIVCFHKSHLFCENMGSFFRPVLIFFFCYYLWQYPCIYKQKPCAYNAIYLLFLFMLSSWTHSLLSLSMLCCSTLYSWYFSQVSFFPARMPSIYYHWSISRLSYYANIDQVCGWWETLLAAHSHFFYRLFRCTVLWGTLSVLYDRKG